MSLIFLSLLFKVPHKSSRSPETRLPLNPVKFQILNTNFQLKLLFEVLHGFSHLLRELLPSELPPVEVRVDGGGELEHGVLGGGLGVLVHPSQVVHHVPHQVGCECSG